MKPKLIAQGAEAKIYLIKSSKKVSPREKKSSQLSKVPAKKSDNVDFEANKSTSEASHFIIKNRIKKSYRIPELDNKIRKQRTKREAKLLNKAGQIINTPKILADPGSGRMIHMQHIQGLKLSEHLDKLKNKLQIAEQIGKQTALLHNNDIIHGDLTTSNMILSNVPKTKAPREKKSSQLTESPAKKSGKADFEANKSTSEASAVGAEVGDAVDIYFIDFGLGFTSKKIEDKAVDIHLIKQAFEAKHFNHFEALTKSFLQGYKQNSKEHQKIFEQLEKVERRGRYKH